jgi:hypothetical protein
MGQFLTRKYLKKAGIFWPEIFLLLFVKGQAFGNFGSNYFHASQIFDKQLGKLPYLQYPWSVVELQQKVHFRVLSTAEPP